MIINDPTGEAYYGGAVAAPLFSSVMEGALRLMFAHIIAQPIR